MESLWSVLSGHRHLLRTVVGCTAVVLLADLLARLLDLGTPGLAVLDEPAHLATALALLSVGSALLATQRVAVPRTLVGVAFASSVLIDVDHVPATVFASHILDAGVDRPYSHSLVTPLAAGLLAVVAGPRTRQLFAGIALGVGLHFVRDIATGPGLALGWPFSDHMVRLPYGLYLAVLLGSVAVAARLRRRRSP